MERHAKIVLMLIATLAAAAVHASSDTLHQYGISAPLRQLAVYPWPGKPGDLADPGVRLTGARRVGLPADAISELASMAPRRYVDTGGTQRNLDGLGDAGGGVSGAVGAEQYVQAAGGAIAIHAKDTGRLMLGPTKINAIFYDAPAGPAMNACRTQRVHDGALLYDQLANRWIASYLAAPTLAAGAAYYQCIAISVGADAAGRYFRYAIELKTPHGAPQFADDAKIALWPDAYYFAFSLFDGAEGEYLGPRICGLDRHALAIGADAMLRCRDPGAAVGPLSPAGMEGYHPPDGNPGALFFGLDHAAGTMQAWSFSWSSSVLSGPTAIRIPDFVVIHGVLQPWPGPALPALGDRLAPRAIYRNIKGRETLVTNHTVLLPGAEAGVRWYEIGDPFGAPYLIQYGTIGGAESRFNGSIGVDRSGNITLGYSVASADTPPGIRYTGREPGDPFGLMQAEEVIVNGAGVLLGDSQAARATGAMALDPIDGCTFWYTQRYVPLSGPASARTRIANFRFRSCH